MNDNEQLIHTFYNAFQQKDWKTMQACYHENIIFNDAVFKNLQGKQAGAMWHMLLQNGKDLQLNFDGVVANEKTGKAKWIATYTFSKTGNKVINDIQAVFEFKDGKIFRHTDSFDFHKWAKQAFGFSGLIMGGFVFFQNTVSKKAMEGLNAFIQKNATLYN